MPAKRTRRKAAPKRKKAVRQSRGGQIPLKVLERRLASLTRTVKARRSKAQLRMWD